MTSASIITISDNSLLGKSQQKTSSVLSRELMLNGFRINSQITIGSKLEKLSEFLGIDNSNFTFFLFENNIEDFHKLNKFISSLTFDDLVPNPYVKDEINKFSKKTNIPLTKEDELGWMLPRRARAIINIGSKQHGYVLNKDNKKYFVVPLDYFAARSIIFNTIVPFLSEDSEAKCKTAIFKTFGVTGLDIRNVLADIRKNKDKVSINVFSSGIEADIVLKTTIDNSDNLATYTQTVFDRLNRFIYAEEDISMYQACYNLLKIKKLSLAIAESVTGGEVTASFIKNNSGASSVIKEGIVAYTVGSKTSRLAINEEIIHSHSHVSAQTTYEMATGLLKTSKADIVLATTGYASSESDEFPAGLCYIAVGDENEIHVYKNQFEGSREEVIESITKAAYFYLIKKLRKNESYSEKTVI